MLMLTPMRKKIEITAIIPLMITTTKAVKPFAVISCHGLTGRVCIR